MIFQFGLLDAASFFIYIRDSKQLYCSSEFTGHGVSPVHLGGGISKQEEKVAQVFTILLSLLNLYGYTV